MIVNDQQYRATQNAIAELRRSLGAFRELSLMQTGIDPVLVKAQRNSINAAIGELQDKLSQYDLAKNRDEAAFRITAIDKLGEQLVAARIANGWTQKDLADRLNLKEQQVQRYEKERYRMASLERVTEIARVLGVRLTGQMETVLTDDRATQAIDDYIASVPVSCFPWAEMKKRRWLPIDMGKKLSEDSKRLLIQGFFARSGLRFVSPMLHSRTNRQQSDVTRCALLAWQARVKYIARSYNRTATFTKITTGFVQHLARLSADSSGPLKAVKFLNANGVFVVFLPHLQRTLLDGAAMLLEDGTPVIGMTLRHDRLDNFWHVLLHEVGHIARHWNCGLAEGFLDEEDDPGGDVREREATEFARNAMVPDEVWRTSFVRYATTKDQIRDFANALGIAPAVVAGRLRFEREDFSALNDIVGKGAVKRMFREANLIED